MARKNLKLGLTPWTGEWRGQTEQMVQQATRVVKALGGQTEPLLLPGFVEAWFSGGCG